MKELFLYNIFIKILLVITLNWLTYRILKFCVPKERDLYKFKIKYFYVNLCICIIYTCFFIFLISKIRTRFLDKDINIYNFYLNFQNIITPLNLLHKILVCATIISIFLFLTILLKEIHEFFINQIIKRYLYALFGTYYGSFFSQNIRQISILGLYTGLYNLLRTFIDSANLTHLIKTRYLLLFRICQYSITKLPLIFILLYFFYELKYNQGILSSKFNSWFFMYILFTLYKRFTIYIAYSDYKINEMVFNMYYRDRSIKYANMPKHWEDAVYKYVDEGLSFYTLEKWSEFEEKIGSIVFLQGMFWKHTWTTKDGYNYTNLNGEDFQEENNQSVDVVKYPYKPQYEFK
jgi:hypothetical protein